MVCAVLLYDLKHSRLVDTSINTNLRNCCVALQLDRSYKATRWWEFFSPMTILWNVCHVSICNWEENHIILWLMTVLKVLTSVCSTMSPLWSKDGSHVKSLLDKESRISWYWASHGQCLCIEESSSPWNSKQNQGPVSQERKGMTAVRPSTGLP